MNEIKRAKLLLLGDEVLDLSEADEFHIGDVKYQQQKTQNYNNNFFRDNFEDLSLKIDMSIICVTENSNIPNKINKAKKVRVVFIDELGNIIR